MELRPGVFTAMPPASPVNSVAAHGLAIAEPVSEGVEPLFDAEILGEAGGSGESVGQPPRAPAFW